MIKKKSEIQGKVVSNLRGGIGDITMFHFLTEQEVKGAGRLFAKTVIEPGNTIGVHKHEGEMEAYYVLKGKALLSDDGVDVILEAGDCQICPDGHTHSLKNVGEESLEFISIILYTKQKVV